MAAWNIADLEKLFEAFNKPEHYVYFKGQEILYMEIRSMQDDQEFSPWFSDFEGDGNGVRHFDETTPDDFEVFVIHKVDWKKS